MQAFSSLVLYADARPGAWPRLVPPEGRAFADRVAAKLTFPAVLRLVIAREALRRGDVGLAGREAAALPDSTDRLALLGGIAEARGDFGVAVCDDLAAGDLAGLESEVQRRIAEGRYAAALALQSAVVARLRSERTQADALAEAEFDLGNVEQTRVYHLWITSPERYGHKLASVRAYERAVALAPFEERYLLALGNQQLNLNDPAAATRTFERARDSDPTSVEALTGLGAAALRRGDRGAAERFLLGARARAPQNQAVRNLARDLGI